LAELNEIREAANQAQRSEQTPEAFAAANPAVAPIINLIVQQKPDRDWLVILLMVLAIVIPYLQNAEDHRHAEREAHAPAVRTTQQLVPQTLAAIERRIEQRLEHDRRGTAPRNTPRQAKRKKQKRYGHAKPKRRR
jgi:hypothetical protein